MLKVSVPNRRKRPRPTIGPDAAYARIYNAALLGALILFAVALVWLR